MTWLPSFFTKGYVTVQKAAVSLVQRPILNFVNGASVVDNTATGSTDITLDRAASALAALAIDWSVASVFTKTLSAGGNTFTFANTTDGQVIIVILTGAASTVTWPTVKWAGGVAPTQTASGTDVYTFVKAGSTIYGSVVQAMA